jgi:hypothetical protein
MQRLEVSCAVRPIYGSLGAKGLTLMCLWNDYCYCFSTCLILTGVNVCLSNRLLEPKLFVSTGAALYSHINNVSDMQTDMTAHICYVRCHDTA